MNLTHKIRLDPTYRQRRYFARAAGTSRFVYNWGLAQWNEAYEAGQKPTASVLKRRFNSLYRKQFPWVAEVHRDCHSQPFADLQKAFGNFFEQRADRPCFKSRNRDRRSFYVANDKLSLAGRTVRLPVLGRVRMQEELRFQGKVLSARVVEECDEWFICVTVELPGAQRPRTGYSPVGVDLGIKHLATLSTGEQVDNPRPLQRAQRKLARAQRCLSRRQRGSCNRQKQKLVVAKIHRRIRNIRQDGLHKLTTRLAKNHGVVVIEDLSPSNMMKNHKLARSISDVGFGLFRQLLTYKSQLYGTLVVTADRFFPSSKLCSNCGLVRDELSLAARTYECACGLRIDRDLNAAINLVRLAGASGEVTPVEMPGGVVEAGTKPCPFLGTY